jgi:NAD(P)-dependent dehydrogenase (short-subunit alcohol dehydrogenase family)
MATFSELSSLSGRTALITGATGGLGKVFAETLAELGANLILVDLPGSDLDALTQELINRWHIDAKSFHCDLELGAKRSELIKKVVNLTGELNVLINNAAFVGSSDLPGWAVDFEDQSLETWRRALEVNLTATFDLCQGLCPKLKASKGSSIINIASIYGMLGPDWSLYEGTNLSNPAAYGVSKGGLIQLTRWLATTISPEVRVNAVSPGGIFRHQEQDFVRRYESRTPIGRMASEEDFRGIIAFLASDLSRYVTGQVISVDGGWTSW